MYLGTEEFTENMQARMDSDRDLSEVPMGHKRRLPKLLGDYERMSGSRDEAIKAAYASGGYTMEEIGEKCP